MIGPSATEMVTRDSDDDDEEEGEHMEEDENEVCMYLTIVYRVFNFVLTISNSMFC